MLITMQPDRRAIIGALLAGAAVRGVRAQTDKPMRFVVGAVPGAGTDVATRRLVASLSEVLGQTAFVDNKPGANGTLAANEVARSPRDGLTLLNAQIGDLLNELLRPGSGARLGQELVPVCGLTEAPLVLLAHPSVPARDMKELIELARSKPGQLNIGSAGPGSMTQVTGERLKRAADISLTEVQYKSIGADLVNLIGGQLDLAFNVWSVAGPQVKAGKVRAIALAGPRRLSSAPDLPTFAEAGLAGFNAIGWNGIFAPAGTPPDVLLRLQQGINEAVARPDFVSYLQMAGSETGKRSREEFTAFIEAERAIYQKIIKDAGIKAE